MTIVIYSYKIFQNFINSVINRVLLSKQLLTDHIEILEHCEAIHIKYINSSNNIYYNCASKGALLVSAVGLTSIKTNHAWYCYVLICKS